MINLLNNFNEEPEYIRLNLEVPYKWANKFLVPVKKHIHKNFKSLKNNLGTVGTAMALLSAIVVMAFSISNIYKRVFAAGELSYSWGFSNSSDYTVSNSAYLQVTNSAAALKVRNYVNDANTALLLHMDDNSGLTVTDSSTYANNAASNVSTWLSTNFNYGLSLNGLNAYISVPDANEISFSQAHTLESWIKFPSNFSANSAPERQYVIDKGEYSLYFDNQTGKLNYELAPSNQDSWSQIGGGNTTFNDGINAGWDLNGKNSVSSNVYIGNSLYVGLGTVVGDAEVWMWNGSTWRMIGGNGSGWSANVYEDVSALATDGTNLFAGLGNGGNEAEVWKWDGATWTQVGGDGISASWTPNYDQVLSMVYTNGSLFVGVGLTATEAEVWKWGGSGNWTKVGGDGVNTSWASAGNYEGVYEMVAQGSSFLYAGLGNSANDAEVWRFNIATTAWTQIGGDSLNSGWTTNYDLITSMVMVGNSLYAGLGLTATEAEIWRWNGTIWAQVGGDGLNSSWASAGNYETVDSMVAVGNSIYAGLGLSAGDDEVWRYNGSTWAQIGGINLTNDFGTRHTRTTALTTDGTNVYAGIVGNAANLGAEYWKYNGTNWSQIGGQGLNDSWGYVAINGVQALATVGDNLYAGLGNSAPGNALLFKYNGSTWTHIAGGNLNSSWSAFQYEKINTIADYNGNPVVGLGNSTTDADVWLSNGSSWSQIGGDGLNSSWNTSYEEVNQLTTHNGVLYATLGTTSGDAEVWKYNNGTWSQVGGDSVNGSWTTANAYEVVQTMLSHNDLLYFGLGSSASDAEVYTFNPSSSAWTKIGGDSTNSSWGAGYETVNTLGIYNNQVVAGIGNTAGEAEVWRWNGTTWSQIGGDNISSSWGTTAIYETVNALVTYNGKLYASLGNSAGDGEVWVYDGSTWAQIGGDGLNNGPANTIENVTTMAVYKGQLMAGTGLTINADAAVWAYGGNALLTSNTSTFGTGWTHIAATYDGTSMKLFINGSLNSQRSASLTMNNGTLPALIGTSYGREDPNSRQGFLNAALDEIRLSNTARSSADFTTTPYTTSAVSVYPNAAVFTSSVLNWYGFSAAGTLNGGTIGYQMSTDGGSTWKYYDGANWSTVSVPNPETTVSTEAQINSNIASLSVTTSGILWKAYLTSADGTQPVSLSTVNITASVDNSAPSAPDTFVVRNAAGGTNILTSGSWYNYSSPQFTWSGASDGAGSGIAGYWVYFGTDSGGEPTTAGNFQTGTAYIGTGMSTNTTYYLKVKTKDAAQNVGTASSTWTYKYDATSPENPSDLFVTPSGYTGTNSYTFFWTAPPGTTEGSDTGGSGVYEYQYKIGPSGTWTSTNATSVTIPDAAYQDGVNVFYLRTIDNAGNTSSANKQVNFYYSGTAPTPPQNLNVSPSYSVTNSFAFSWNAPTSFIGNASDITYCYTVNTLPSDSTCTFTSPGATSLSAQAFANQYGANTFYLVAKDGTGNISYSTVTSVEFTADTDAPGIPLNVEIADVSVKSTSSWKLALSWEPPTGAADDITYEVYTSTDASTYTFEAEVSGIAHIDTGLTQVLHYYKVRACDSANNCGAYSTVVSMLPNGRYTDAATLTSDPVVSSITTKQATITWSTDRASDTRLAYGTSEGDYFDEEPSNSTQQTDHTINLTNLKPGTRYYFIAKWTDEDGNLGQSEEDTFTTSPAPTVTDPKVAYVNLTTATLKYTVKGASKVRIYYGTTSNFGSTVEVSTSSSESTYNTILEELLDGTKYFYKINSFDTEGEEYEGNTLTFETLPRPKITSVRIQQVIGTAQPAVLVTWETNTLTSSIATYYPVSDPSKARDEVNVELVKGAHRLVLRGLEPQTPYTLIVKGIDNSGNEAISDAQRFTTATDTRAPQISDMTIEGTVIQNGTAQDSYTAQLVVSWNSDEPSTSQVEFGEGTGSTYTQKTQEDSNQTYNHTVVISGLTPSRVYHLRVVSKDAAGNAGYSVDTVTITPKASDSALNLVVNNLSQIFGFLNAGN